MLHHTLVRCHRYDPNGTLPPRGAPKTSAAQDETRTVLATSTESGESKHTAGMLPLHQHSRCERGEPRETDPEPSRPASLGPRLRCRGVDRSPAGRPTK